MNTPTKIEQLHGQPSFHFWHLGQEYFIYLNTSSEEEGKDARFFSLSIPKKQLDYYVAEEILRSQHWKIEKVNPDDVREGIKQLFLPKVNEYLMSLGGDEEETSEGFPITGEALEQYNYVVENLLQYANGIVSLK